MSCTGYIFTNTDQDFHRFSITTGTGTVKVQLTNIPAGANYDVYVYAPYFSPSSHMAVGYNTSNGDEDYTITLLTGSTAYTTPNIGTCVSTSNGTGSLYQLGYCYGEGTSGGTHNIYVIVTGRNGSYNQTGKYTLTVTTSSAPGTPVANE